MVGPGPCLPRRQKETGTAVPPRLALVLAAEKLVALRGANGFTVRMLNQEAGPRNTSAVFYHFGSMGKLIRAVWEHRMGAINPRRLALLEGVWPGDFERIVAAIVVPLSEQLQPRKEGNFYLRSLERLAREVDYGEHAPAVDWAEGWIAAFGLMRQGLAGIRPEMIDLKVRFVITLITSGLADTEAHLEKDGVSRSSLPTMVAALQAAAVALLRAPLEPPPAGNAGDAPEGENLLSV